MKQLLGVDIPGSYIIDTECRRVILTDLPCKVQPVSVRNTTLDIFWEISPNLKSTLIPIPEGFQISGSDVLEIILDVAEEDFIYYCNWK